MADKLEDAGLSEGAALARAALEQIEDEAPAELADILSDAIMGNQRARLAALYRQGHCTMDMRNGIDPDTMAFVYRSVRITGARKP